MRTAPLARSERERQPGAFNLKLSALLTAAALSVLAAAPAIAGPVFGSASYNASLTLNGGGGGTATGAAFSGGSYYVTYGGSSLSPISRTDAAGVLVEGPSSPTPGIDFRSIFTDGAGDVFARGFNSNVIYRQTSFGNFASVVTLAGTLDAQSQVVLTADFQHYVGNDNGTLRFWDLTGASTGAVALGGGFDTGYPQGRAVSVFGDYALNYDAGVLSAYSLSTGALVDQTTLNGASTSFDGHFGQSYANGYFFVPVSGGAEYVGYQIGVPSGPGGGAIPEPGAWALMILGFGAAGSALRRRRTALTPA